MTLISLNSEQSCLGKIFAQTHSIRDFSKQLMTCLQTTLHAESGQLYLSDATDKFKCVYKTTDYQPKTLETPSPENMSLSEDQQLTLPVELNQQLIGFIVLQQVEQAVLEDNIANIKQLYSQLGNTFNLLQAKENLENELRIINEHSIHFKTDPQLHIKHPSEAFISTLGFPKEELEGKTIYDLFPIQGDKPLVNQKQEFNLTSKTGDEIWLEVQSKPLYDVLGNRAGNLFIQKDISEQKKVEKMAIKDDLTDLYNRRFFNQIFPKQLDIARRNDSCIAFMIIDVDYFKQYNDHYGHASGDRILQEVSQAIINCYRRRGDYVFRLGGEEFGVICNITTTDDAEMLSNLTRNAIESLKLDHQESPYQHVTISCGVFVGQGDDIPQDEQEVYIAADKALYEAKSSGRNRVSIYGSSDDIVLV